MREIMRIAFIVADFPILSETFILNQATGLLDRGHEVDIYTDNVGNWSAVHPDVNRYGLRQRTYPMQKIPKNYLWRILKGVWLGLSCFLRAPRLVLRSLNIPKYGVQAAGLWLLYTAASLAPRQPQYDIIHCQFGTQGYRGLALKRLLSPTPKLILMFRGHDISCYLQQGGAQVYRYLFGQVDFCLANCEFFRQRVIELGCGPQQVAVHRSGLNLDKFTFRPRHSSSGEPVRILTVGRLVEKKGIEYAIRAVAQVQPRGNLEYHIIGDGPLRPSLKGLIHNLGAEAYIHLVGWKNEADIIAALNTAHLFIAPSITAADGNQDAPINVLKEAMATGMPVLSTLHGGIPELVQDGVSGYLVPEKDADSLAQRLEDLLAASENWAAMGAAGRRYVEQHYDIQALNNRLVAVYEQLLAGNSSVRSHRPSPVHALNPRQSGYLPHD